MGTDHPNGVAGLPLLPDGKGDDGGGIAGQVVFLARLQLRGPRVSFLERTRSALLPKRVHKCHNKVGSAPS
jgi:hypothetical protein